MRKEERQTELKLQNPGCFHAQTLPTFLLSLSPGLAHWAECGVAGRRHGGHMWRKEMGTLRTVSFHRSRVSGKEKYECVDVMNTLGEDASRGGLLID